MPRAAGTSAWIPHASFLGLRVIPGLDAVRALAVLFVVASHGRLAVLHDHVTGKPGVFAFFVLSGLLITTLLLSEEERTGRVRVRAFIIRRLTRIVPLLYLVMALTSVAVLVLHLDQRATAYRGAAPWILALLPEIPYAAGGDYPMNVTWSIGIEEKFYLLWPVLAFGIPAIRHRLRAPLAALVVCVSLLLAVLVDPRLFLGYAAIGLGCLAALALRHPGLYGAMVPVLHRRSARLVAWPAIGLALLSTWHDNTPGTMIFSVVVGACLIGVITSPRPPRLLRSRFLVFVGSISYGVYLVHYNVLRALEFVIPQEAIAAQAGTILLGLAISLVAAAASKRWFEEPIRSWGRRLTRPPRTRATEPSMTVPVGP